MNLGIATIDMLSMCMFFSAAVLALVANREAHGRTRLWASAALAFGILALDRAANAVEWSGADELRWLDALQGYLSTFACLVILMLPVRFLLVAGRTKDK